MKAKGKTMHKTTYHHIIKTEGINGGAATIEGTRHCRMACGRVLLRDWHVC